MSISGIGANGTNCSQYLYKNSEINEAQELFASNSCVTNPKLSEDVVSFSNAAKNVPKDSAASLKADLENTKEKQGFIGKLWNGFKNLTGIGAGSNKAQNAIEQYEKGEISYEEAKAKVEGYKEGQSTALDVVADMASGIVAVGAFALAVPTGGASLAFGLGLATTTGAGVKVGIKAGSALLNDREYSAKDLLHDSATGAINGLLAPVTNGIGASVTKTVGKKLGLTVIKEGGEELVEQGVKQGVKSGFRKLVTQETVDVLGGTLSKRAFALGAGMAVDGALGGAGDNMVRAAINGEDFEGILKAGGQGAVGGLILSPIIGGGFRMAGKAGHAINNKINTKEILPDSQKVASLNSCDIKKTLDASCDEVKTRKINAKTENLNGDDEKIIQSILNMEEFSGKPLDVEQTSFFEEHLGNIIKFNGDKAQIKLNNGETLDVSILVDEINGKKFLNVFDADGNRISSVYNCALMSKKTFADYLNEINIKESQISQNATTEQTKKFYIDFLENITKENRRPTPEEIVNIFPKGEELPTITEHQASSNISDVLSLKWTDLDNVDWEIRLHSPDISSLKDGWVYRIGYKTKNGTKYLDGFTKDFTGKPKGLKSVSSHLDMHGIYNDIQTPLNDSNFTRSISFLSQAITEDSVLQYQGYKGFKTFLAKIAREEGTINPDKLGNVKYDNNYPIEKLIELLKSNEEIKKYFPNFQ